MKCMTKSWLWMPEHAMNSKTSRGWRILWSILFLKAPGKSSGVAVITATTSNGKSSACVVTVRAKTAYDAPYDKDAIYADMVSYGIGKGFTLDTALSADSAEYFEEYTGDGWYQDAPESLWSKCAWMIDNAAQSVTSSTGSMDGHRFNILLKADNNGEYHIYVLYQ